MAKKITVPVHRRELWRKTECAAMMGISLTSFYALERDELFGPELVAVLDTLPAYRSAEVRDWLCAGCPPRSRWSWQPSQPMKLTELIAQRRRELHELETELTATKAQLRSVGL